MMACGVVFQIHVLYNSGVVYGMYEHRRMYHAFGMWHVRDMWLAMSTRAAHTADCRRSPNHAARAGSNRVQHGVRRRRR